MAQTASARRTGIVKTLTVEGEQTTARYSMLTPPPAGAAVPFGWNALTAAALRQLSTADYLALYADFLAFLGVPAALRAGMLARAEYDESACLLPEPPPPTAQDAPTGGLVSDAYDTFDFTPAVGPDGQALPAERHEYRYAETVEGVRQAETAWAPVLQKPIPVGNRHIAAGDLSVRVAAHAGLPASPALTSAEAFTITPNAPTNMQVDTAAYTFTFDEATY